MVTIHKAITMLLKRNGCIGIHIHIHALGGLGSDVSDFRADFHTKWVGKRRPCAREGWFSGANNKTVFIVLGAHGGGGGGWGSSA